MEYFQIPWVHPQDVEPARGGRFLVRCVYVNSRFFYDWEIALVVKRTSRASPKGE